MVFKTMVSAHKVSEVEHSDAKVSRETGIRKLSNAVLLVPDVMHLRSFVNVAVNSSPNNHDNEALTNFLSYYLPNKAFFTRSNALVTCFNCPGRK